MPFNIVAEIIPSVTGGLFNFERVAVVEDALETSPAIIIANYLRQEGLVTDPDDNLDWPLYISYFPDILSQQGSIYDTTGIKDGKLMMGTVIQDYGIQIKIGSDNHNEGWNKAEAIGLNLDSVLDKLININGEDFIIHQVSRAGPPTYIGVEEGIKRRKLFTVNCLVSVCRC